MTDFIRSHRAHFSIQRFIKEVIQEDLGDGDHTSNATIPATKTGEMKLLVKEEGVIAGVEAAERIFKTISKRMKVVTLITDGHAVKKGDVVLTVKGPVREMLLAERLVLNIMQRMSGIATHTARLQQLCKGTTCQVIDTRKTTPGFRFFEKWAVLIGGGSNHRFGLYDMILIKDNHIDFCGGIPQAIDAANHYLKKKKKKLRIEVETRSLQDVKTALQHGGFHRIMLDNFSVKDTRKAVQLINGHYEVESSGGINANTLAAYAKCGVDFISVGALTHHVQSLDLSLKAVSTR